MLGESFISVAGYLFMGLWSVFVTAFVLVTFARDLVPATLRSVLIPSHRSSSNRR